MSTYLWIDLGAVFFPLVFSFHPRLRFYREWWALAPGLLLMMAVFIPWDALFAARGIWGFGAEQVCGLSLLGLPVEEWAFFVCVPYACVFTYHCFRVLGVKDHFGPWAKGISVALVALSLIVGALFFDRAYTATAYLGMAVGVAFVTFVLRATWLGRFYFAYFVLQVPFLIVNGLLTGSGLASPVVWYNDAENLGLRIGTIPVEDTFYGLLMVLLTVTGYELVRARRGVEAGIPVPR
ncbi:MAG TPA: lycopene cyclase domain-containing protein [Flavobacteriales bacterium]|jgi:lycopene cyclase domain-containing protein|nr:lycopene cyclase domain-containing protein [Flavobacteriales bacterium]